MKSFVEMWEAFSLVGAMCCDDNMGGMDEVIE